MQKNRTLARLLAMDGPLELLEAAFWVAAEEYPDLDVKHGVQRVRLLSAEGARQVCSPKSTQPVPSGRCKPNQTRPKA